MLNEEKRGFINKNAGCSGSNENHNFHVEQDAQLALMAVLKFINSISGQMENAGVTANYLSFVHAT